MKFSEYELELQLAYKQHPKNSREEEVYSLILTLLRDVYSEKIYNEKVFSIRDIHQSPNPRIDTLYGEAGYPDFAFYSQNLEDDTNPNEKEKILGVVEAKAIGETYKNDVVHILGEIKSFKKVLYTNGILWKFYDDEKKKVTSLDEGYIWKINLLGEETENESAVFSKKTEKVIPGLSFSKWRMLRKKLRECTEWDNKFK